MFVKTIKVWLLFYIIMEIVVNGIVEYYNCNILNFEIVKCIIYAVSYVLVNLGIKKRKIDDEAAVGLNSGVSLALSSVLSAISITMILKSDSNIGWFIFLLTYIGVMILFFVIWKKSVVAVEDGKDKKNAVPVEIFAGVGTLTAIGFARIDSNNVLKIIFTTLAIIIVLLSLFMALLFFVKYKKELKDIFNFYVEK